jgi:hypothetical protein
MPIYRTKGTLTGTIEPENVTAAQAYLTQYDMTQFLDRPLSDAIEHIEWKLEGDGHSWSVTAFATRQLVTAELEQLASWVSGQNSDGLGESFEQQSFAETENEDEVDCADCVGSGSVDSYDDEAYTGEQETCDRCGGDGVLYHESWGMISFDWQKNDCVFERVK